MARSDAWEMSEGMLVLRDTVRRLLTNDVKPAEDRVEHDARKLPLPKKARDLLRNQSGRN